MPSVLNQFHSVRALLGDSRINSDRQYSQLRVAIDQNFAYTNQQQSRLMAKFQELERNQLASIVTTNVPPQVHGNMSTALRTRSIFEQYTIAKSCCRCCHHRHLPSTSSSSVAYHRCKCTPGFTNSPAGSTLPAQMSAKALSWHQGSITHQRHRCPIPGGIALLGKNTKGCWRQKSGYVNIKSKRISRLKSVIQAIDMKNAVYRSTYPDDAAHNER
jgi:hypothetical protein